LFNRYILRHIGPPAALAFAVIAFLAMVVGIYEQLDQIPLEQVTFRDLGVISMLSLPAFVAFIAPITYMMGILAAFAAFVQSNELVAMKAAGVSMKRIVLPVIVTGALLSVACFLVTDQLKPWAMKRVYNLIYSDLPLRASIDLLPPGVMHRFAGWRVYIGAKAEGSSVLRDIVILQPQSEEGPAAFYAEEARLTRHAEGSTLVLTQGHWIQSRGEGGVMHASSPEMKLPIPQLEPREPEGDRQSFTLRQLLAREQELAASFAVNQDIPTYRTLLRDRAEIVNRLAFPLMCLTVSLVAAPAAARVQRGGRSYVFAIGFVVILTYFVLRSMTAVQVLLPLPAMIAIGQIPNIVLAAAGLVLLWRVDRI
jgi:lipopolysaccharide export LptBFGC system permease protein LptF